jgi:hypothetical protein
VQLYLRLTNIVSHLMTILLQFSSFSCSDAVQSLRAKTAGTKRLTQGLPLDLLKPFNNDSLLNRALADANKQFDVLVQKHGRDFVVRDEDVLSQEMQKGFVNFYGVLTVLVHVPVPQLTRRQTQERLCRTSLSQPAGHGS